jgi:predicted alpha/beta superfamily hydrolase
MLKIKHALLFLILIANISIAQKVELDSLFFESTQSYRTYKVWLPVDYDSSKTYQTIYCFDGDLLFNILSANVEIYSDQSVGRLPPTIVVGVFFDQRNNDMGIEWEKGELNGTGRAFMQLVSKDLLLRIEQDYNVSDYRAIVGHSNSTTFAHFFLTGEFPLFSGYLTLSQFELSTDLQNFNKLKNELKSEIDMVTVTGGRDADFRIESGAVLTNLLDSLNISNLKHVPIYLEKADHLSMVMQGVPLGLEELYADFGKQFSVDSVIKPHYQSPLSYVDGMVERRCSKYGVESVYRMEDLDLLFDLFIERKDSIGIKIATSKYAEMFQDSSEYFYEAQCLEMMGAYQSAEKSYLKHLSHCSYLGYWSYIRITWLYRSELNNGTEAIKWCETGLAALGDERFLNEYLRISEVHPKTINVCIESLENYENEAATEELRLAVQATLAQLYKKVGNRN